MKTIVIYYSRKSSNKFLAEKISNSLQADSEAIRPRLNVFFLFLMNINFGIKKIKSSINNYDRVILCGPVWMGRFIPPLKSFLKKYRNDIKRLVFVTCCGSTFEKKDEKFGHGLVFDLVKEAANGKCKMCQAFPIGLVLPEDKKDDADAFMQTHLNEENFKGEIRDIYDSFIEKVKAMTTSD